MDARRPIQLGRAKTNTSERQSLDLCNLLFSHVNSASCDRTFPAIYQICAVPVTILSCSKPCS